MNTKEAQQKLKVLFSTIFGKDKVVTEWPSYRNAKDWLRRTQDDAVLTYSPRPDIAIGPSNIKEGINIKEIEKMFRKHRQFFVSLGLPNGFENGNENPRCLIVVEIENHSSSKHILGGMINASVLGKVGIIVTLHDKIHKKAERIHKYLLGAYERNKTMQSPLNIVVKEYRELMKILKGYSNLEFRH